MLFRKYAGEWAAVLAQTAQVKDSYKQELIRYVIELLLSGALSLALIVIFSMVCGVLKTALLITLASAVLKSFTGGLHMSTPLRCAVAGAFVTVVLSYIAICFPLTQYAVYSRVLFLATVNVIVWKNAPCEAKGKPLTGGQKEKLAFFSRVLVFAVSITCLFCTSTPGINELFYALLFQGINLLEVTGVGIDKIDRLMGFLEKKPVF